MNKQEFRIILKKYISPSGIMFLRKLVSSFLYFLEWLVWGGRIREWILIKTLFLHYQSVFRRQWLWSINPPHFSNQQLGMFLFAFSKNPISASVFYRAFYTSEVVRKGDVVLDIGCGDGFITKRFISTKCNTVDGVDIEQSAIHVAKRRNSAPNIQYYLLDAVKENFPQNKYDLIVWDGALGHFSSGVTELMLDKIKMALTEDGVFVGSESLGYEGHDHLQFFNNLGDLGIIFKKHFKYVQLKQADYYINNNSYYRQEAYWRCSNDEKRLQSLQWNMAI